LKQLAEMSHWHFPAGGEHDDDFDDYSHLPNPFSGRDADRGDYDCSLPLFQQDRETLSGMPRFDSMIASCLDMDSDVPHELAVRQAADHLHEVVDAYLAEVPSAGDTDSLTPEQAARLEAGDMFLTILDYILRDLPALCLKAADKARKHRISQIKNASAKADKKAMKASAASDLGAPAGSAPATSVVDQAPEDAAVSAAPTSTMPASAGAGGEASTVQSLIKKEHGMRTSPGEALTSAESMPEPNAEKLAKKASTDSDLGAPAGSARAQANQETGAVAGPSPAPTGTTAGPGQQSTAAGVTTEAHATQTMTKQAAHSHPAAGSPLPSKANTQRSAARSVVVHHRFPGGGGGGGVAGSAT
jgi:hypothetical protein